MKVFIEPAPDQWAELLARPVLQTQDLRARIAPIIEAVRQEGDAALLRFNRRFDGYEGALQVPAHAIEEAPKQIDASLWQALQQAYANIRAFHEAQKEEPKIIETMPGVRCWRRSVGIERVGIYVPGGTAPLFSTVLMLGVPAQIAGCSEVVLCTPAGAEGAVHPAILAAASLCGIRKIFAVGGAQAIAAMAFGTESIPKVDKVFGPGNQYVTAAKQMLSAEGIIAIDLPAGPSEVAVWADAQAPAPFLAADLLSQAEHGPDSQVILVCDTEAQVQAVLQAIEKQLSQLPRAGIAREALRHSRAFVMKQPEQALRLLNSYAPEHLIIARQDASRWVNHVTHAGSVFLGYYTPESAGDYASGTNHTLPTNGFARMYSGVSLDSFVKKITFQEISAEGLQKLGKTIGTMAAAEGLDAHRLAVDVRLNALSPNPPQL